MKEKHDDRLTNEPINSRGYKVPYHPVDNEGINSVDPLQVLPLRWVLSGRLHLLG